MTIFYIPRFTFLVCFCLTINVLFAQKNNVQISGTAASYPNEEISVWYSADYISNYRKQLTFAVIDSVGNFSLSFYHPAIQLITLKINKSVTSMYVEPNGKYEVQIAAPDSTVYFNPNIEHDVAVSIKLKSKTEINALTMDYDKRFDDFLGVDYKSFVSRTPQAKIDSFKLAMDNYYSTVQNQYFKNYINYSVASLQEKVKVGDKRLYKKYIENKAILYNHPEYMNFFNTFYKQKLEMFSLSEQGKGVNFTINESANFKATKEFLKRDEFLKNDTICELVLIKGLYEGYYANTFKRSSIKAMLQQAVVDCVVEEHRQIAAHCLNSFSQLQKGSQAPFFELPDKNGKTHSLDEIRIKKIVYLMFYDASCVSCLQQMKTVSSLKKQFGDKIEFVSISSDKKNSELQNFLLKNPKYDWLFLYDDTDGKLRGQYEVITTPAYFLIAPDGKFIQVPAENPEQNIEQVFYDLTKPKTKLHNVGSKQNN